MDNLRGREPMEPNNEDERSRSREAPQRGLYGHLKSHEDWLYDHGFQPEQASRAQSTEHFREQPEKAASQEEALDKVFYLRTNSKINRHYLNPLPS